MRAGLQQGIFVWHQADLPDRWHLPIRKLSDDHDHRYVQSGLRLPRLELMSNDSRAGLCLRGANCGVGGVQADLQVQGRLSKRGQRQAELLQSYGSVRGGAGWRVRLDPQNNTVIVGMGSTIPQRGLAGQRGETVQCLWPLPGAVTLFMLAMSSTANLPVITATKP